jgi:DNA-binding transcriptional ArsR family regulator
MPSLPSAVPSGTVIAVVASLIGDTARANMLAALMGGVALTAGELAAEAGVTAATASGHLARLADGGLVTVARQGRHRYYRLASATVADAIQALMMVAVAGPPRHRPPGPRDAALRLARTCYDHMAGRLAIAVTDALDARGLVVVAEDAALVTDEGRRFFCDFGLDLDTAASRRPFCRTCLDWSERRPHLAGRVGAALLGRVIDLGWVARQPGTRALRLTGAGERGFRAAFALPADWRAPAGANADARRGLVAIGRTRNFC